MKRLVVLLYGVGSYLCFQGVFLYSVGFIGGFGVPTTLNAVGPLVSPTAVAVDLLLLLAFAVQHSLMARPAFKRWLTHWIPPAAERSTYVLASNLVMVVLFCQWRPLGGIVWEVQAPALKATLYGLYALGWLTVLLATCLINHFDLFGLRQVWLYYCGLPDTPLPFATPGPYKIIRHPLYVGWLLTFWSAPTMTVSHLVFALGMTVYILIAIQLEERDLVHFHPGYADYRRQVPMLIPRLHMLRTPAELAAAPSILLEDQSSDTSALA